MSIFSSPKPPPPPPAPVEDPQAVADREKQKKDQEERARRAAGRQANLLGGEQDSRPAGTGITAPTRKLLG